MQDHFVLKTHSIYRVILLCALQLACAHSDSVPSSRGYESPGEALAQAWGLPATDFEEVTQPIALLSPHAPLTLCGGSNDAVLRSYHVPGRKPGSRMPWQFFLGHAAHRLIAYMYGIEHPGHKVYYNTDTIETIVIDSRIGDPALLLPNEGLLRPDITDLNNRYVFEIKSCNNDGPQACRQQVLSYLFALNRTMPPGKLFSGGTGFQGESLILFGQGCQVWRLTWQNPEPGVILYHWTRSQQCFKSAAEAYASGQWVEITLEEMMVYGGWVAQAVEGMVHRREQLASASKSFGIVIHVLGTGSLAIFSGVLFSHLGSASAHGGAKVIPFPSKAPPAKPPVALPKASGM